MKHQPYENWIFTQEDLDMDQAKELRVHLKLCERCNALASALTDVETQFASDSLISPASGFTSRWRERLEKRKQVSHRRQTSILFGGLSVGALILFIPLLIRWFLTALSPGDLISGFVQDFVNWFAIIGFTGDVTVGVLDGMVDTIPVGWWFTFALVPVGLCSLWLFMMHRIRPKPKVVNGA
jgi:hypothetical protein